MFRQLLSDTHAQRQQHTQHEQYTGPDGHRITNLVGAGNKLKTDSMLAWRNFQGAKHVVGSEDRHFLIVDGGHPSVGIVYLRKYRQTFARYISFVHHGVGFSSYQSNGTRRVVGVINLKL